MTTAPLSEPARFHLTCDSPRLRLSVATAEGRDDWPWGRFPITASPQRISDAFHSYLRSHPDIDNVVFTVDGRPRSRPYLEAHVVGGQVHVKLAPLANSDPNARAVVHHLHAAITEAFKRLHSTKLETTLDIAGLHRWAQAVLAHADTDGPDAVMARKVLDMLA
ncbi:hypothetical protein ACWIGI_34605 [Nocardia sp. NPDC055321]